MISVSARHRRPRLVKTDFRRWRKGQNAVRLNRRNTSNPMSVHRGSPTGGSTGARNFDCNYISRGKRDAKKKMIYRVPFMSFLVLCSMLQIYRLVPGCELTSAIHSASLRSNRKQRQGSRERRGRVAESVESERFPRGRTVHGRLVPLFI